MDNNYQTDIEAEQARKARRRYLWRTNPLWIIFVFAAWYILISGIIGSLPFQLIAIALRGVASDGFIFTYEMYLMTLGSVIILFILTWCFKDNRYIWKSFLLRKRGPRLEQQPFEDELADFYGRSRNSIGRLWIGILLGFLTNFVCVLCALIHGDIKLYFEAAPSQIPLFIFALVAVCIQSTSEELWCRGFLYQRLHERFPLWVSVAVNGVLFGLLHVFNPGASVLSIVSIVICGLSYSLLRWYTGSIWVAMGIHTGWNFTQNYLFGLPNSGLVSQVSLFHLDAANGMSNLIYDFDFGVEGALPAILMDALVGVLCLILAKREGRLGELGLNRPQTMALMRRTEA